MCLMNLVSEGLYVRVPGDVADEPGASLPYHHARNMWSVIVKEVALHHW